MCLNPRIYTSCRGAVGPPALTLFWCHWSSSFANIEMQLHSGASVVCTLKLHLLVKFADCNLWGITLLCILQLKLHSLLEFSSRQRCFVLCDVTSQHSNIHLTMLGCQHNPMHFSVPLTVLTSSHHDAREVEVIELGQSECCKQYCNEQTRLNYKQGTLTREKHLLSLCLLPVFLHFCRPCHCVLCGMFHLRCTSIVPMLRLRWR